jgi:phospholipase C
MKNRTLKTALLSTAAILAVAATVAATGPGAVAKDKKGNSVTDTVNALPTKTPIKHLVVILQENRSFDHYFGTYPNALNVEGEPAFKAAKGTPTDINNLLSNPALLDNNPNANPNVVPSNGQTVTQPSNGINASNPFRLDRTQANTADQSHSYGSEQKAYDAGKNDLFPLDTGSATAGGPGAFGTKGQVMGYYDGNTVTAFWNYAQNYAMSDNAWTDSFGPSTPGALHMFSGQTNGAVAPAGFGQSGLADGQGGFTQNGDTDPAFDVCSSTSSRVQMTSQNIGDLLNDAEIPWGSFVGGFNLQTINNNGSSGCLGVNSQGQPAPTNLGRTSASQVIGGLGATIPDYVPHHIWFQYYQSTSNPNHLAPNSIASIGLTNIPGKNKADPANHAYDLNQFEAAVGQGNYPAVSFIKMATFQDAHPGNSDPLDEQTGLVNLINFLQQQPDWDSTAVIITYDDSDGWYDHASAPITHPSFSSSDALTAPGQCGVVGTTEPLGLNNLPVHGRCGPGTRVPFLVISPYAKSNYVGHVLISQASIPQFVEDNWLNGKRLGGGSFDATTGSIMDMFNFKKANTKTLILDPTFGTVDTKSKSKS